MSIGGVAKTNLTPLSRTRTDRPTDQLRAPTGDRRPLLALPFFIGDVFLEAQKVFFLFLQVAVVVRYLFCEAPPLQLMGSRTPENLEKM